jgi:hypothetical protein
MTQIRNQVAAAGHAQVAFRCQQCDVGAIPGHCREPAQRLRAGALIQHEDVDRGTRLPTGRPDRGDGLFRSFQRQDDDIRVIASVRRFGRTGDRADHQSNVSSGGIAR